MKNVMYCLLHLYNYHPTATISLCLLLHMAKCV